MVKIMMHGCNGKMGRMITEIVKNDENAVITAGVDTYTETPNDYPVFDSVEKCTEDADVVIDFSNAGAVDALLDYCVDKKLPVVLCTTGLSEEQLAKVEKAAEKTAVLKSANMSLGINLLLKLLKDAAKVLAPAGYDIELVTIRNWTLRAEQRLRLRIRLMKRLETNIIMYMTEALSARNVMQKRSEFQLFAEVRS